MLLKNRQISKFTDMIAMSSRYNSSIKIAIYTCALLVGSIIIGDPVGAADASGPAADEAFLELSARYGETFNFFTISTLWTLIAAAMVFMMHLGFATLESGLTQSKNCVNVLFKNVFTVCMGVFMYALIGFNMMYPNGNWLIPNVFAMGYPIAADPLTNTDYSYGGMDLCMTGWADFIFQAMFAATAATIVSGAVAERIKVKSYMIFATVLVTLVYPVSGSWKWGKGWLDQIGFHDFAGSTIVHGFGGFAALACVLILGPRMGKYIDGKVRPIPAHSFPLAAIGVFLLFFGWFGFNGGSVLSANPEQVSYVFVTTGLAGATGGLFSIAISWGVLKKPDLSMAMNGVLAGLVGITAGADAVTLWSAVIIGAIAGILVFGSILFFDRRGIDDPVGAVSVHGVCGIWGTLAVGIPFFNGWNPEISFLTQLIGAVVVCLWAFACSLGIFYAIKATVGVRVGEDEEFSGLDIGEHGQEAYADFQGRSR